MKRESAAPRTLMEAISYFAKPGVARDFVAQLRWPKGPFCEKCGETDPMFLASVERWKCRGCGVQFSVKKGTIMEDSPISLDKWLCAMWMIANCKNGVSSYEIHRALGVTQKSAWFMLHRIRLAMQNKSINKMKGPVEVDESFIGGKVGNMSNKKRREFGARGNPRKAVVLGMLERGGEIRAEVVSNTKRNTLVPRIEENVAPGARVFTDSLPTYVVLRENFLHESVNHFRDEWVRGEAHTNGIENFWSLFKRSLGGTYVNVEPFHLFRYLDEQVFRFNNRKDTDAGRFGKLLSLLSGKRLTFKALTTGMEAQTC
ncbi:MAG: IS1595 family transposase [Acidobacteriota bacterium]|nr:IS1595 family transposase [Acidobacteriota bacterium]